jgi:SHS2 domain-containing protein
VTYRWVEHTAELELEVRATNEEGIFAEAVAAFAEVIGPGSGKDVSHELSMQAEERDGQLVELLEELVFLADTSCFVPRRLAQIDLVTGRATIEGYKGAPSPLVKGVTYHRLEFRHDDGAWLARVVLDV